MWPRTRAGRLSYRPGERRSAPWGTSFTVSRLPQRPIQVLVREGTVELKRADMPDAPPVRASANVRAIVPP